MTTKAVTITIEGKTQTGKSALAQMIGQALTEAGFSVEVNDADRPRIKSALDIALRAIAPRVAVTIDVKHIPYGAAHD